MKKYTLTFSFMALLFAAMASDAAYEKAMQKEVEKFLSAQSPEDFQKSAHAFARIGEMNQEEWLPQYYAALSYANLGFMSQEGLDKKDALFDQAKRYVEKAAGLSPSNSEIVALQGFIVMGQIAADPGSRGPSLSQQAMQTFGRAIELDKSNPRALIMMAQMEMGMAQFFGQGTEKACGMARASIELFTKEAEASEEGSIEPRWGKEMAEQLLQSCP